MAALRAKFNVGAEKEDIDRIFDTRAQFVVKRVDTSENVVDLFTKSLPRTTFEKHASSVFLCWYY